MTDRQSGILKYLLFLLILSGIGASAFLVINQPDESKLSQIRKSGTIRLGYAQEKPYSFADESGQITGAWPEIARRVLERMGVRKIEWAQCEFGSLLDDLEDGRFEIVAAGMFQTPKRQQRAAFSLPVALIRAGLLVPAGNPEQLRGYADVVARKNIRVVVLHGAVEEKDLLHLGISPLALLTVPDAESGFSAVKSGQAAALALSLPTLRYRAAQDSALEAIPAWPDDDSAPIPAIAGFVFRLSDPELREEFDRVLREFRREPEYTQILESFGFSAQGVLDFEKETP